MWFYSIFSLTFMSSVQSFPLSPSITLFCLPISSELFHVQTGNNQAFTGSSRVEWGPYLRYTCQRLFYSVGDKNTPLHTMHRFTHAQWSWEWSVTNGDRLIQWESSLCHSAWICVCAVYKEPCFYEMPPDENEVLQKKVSYFKEKKETSKLQDKKINSNI